LADPLLLANPTSEGESDVASSRVADDDNLFWWNVLTKNKVAVDRGGVLQSGGEGIGEQAILDGCKGSARSATGRLGRSL
jgi:hypothetical protein